MYVHVPAAWMALMCYTALALSSVVGFIWNHPLADVAARATAPIGAVFTAVALVTGSLWGKPMWGAWWAWDARLTSVLILFFLYLGYMTVWAAIEDKARAARLAALVAIVGFVNVPIIKFSVDWWNSLHQPASVLRAGGATIDSAMLTPLFLMGGGYMALFAALLIASMRNEIAARRLARTRRGRRKANLHSSHRMTRKQNRMALIGGVFAIAALAVGLTLTALGRSVAYFYTPSDLAALAGPPSGVVRLGGLVETGSVHYTDDKAEVRFVVKDEAASTPVVFAGILPDLFREGQGVVVEGEIGLDGALRATQVLAKHDENYMPREVADALKKQGRWKEGEAPRAP